MESMKKTLLFFFLKKVNIKGLPLTTCQITNPNVKWAAYSQSKH